MKPDQMLDDLHADLGFKTLNPIWAKAEIFLGLLATATGGLTGVRGVVAAAGVNWQLAMSGTVLATLGGYLAMAGHRSHLYQSANLVAAWLAARITIARAEVSPGNES